MVEFELKNFEGRLYLKDELRKILSNKQLRAVAHGEVVLLVNDHLSDKEVLHSVDLIRAELMDYTKQKEIQHNGRKT